jgi:hypothetical protein
MYLIVGFGVSGGDVVGGRCWPGLTNCIRDDFFRLVVSLRHLRPPLKSITPRWTNSSEEHQTPKSVR